VARAAHVLLALRVPPQERVGQRGREPRRDGAAPAGCDAHAEQRRHEHDAVDLLVDVQLGNAMREMFEQLRL